MPFTTRKETESFPHIIIDAAPGSGKTSTMIAGLNILSGGKPEWEGTIEQKAIWHAMRGHYSSIGFQAFNKSIATEIQERVPSNVKASTFHAFGFNVLRENGYKLKPNGNNVQYIVKDIQGYGKKDRQKTNDYRNGIVVSKVVSLLKNHLMEATPANVNLMIDNFNINVPKGVLIEDVITLSNKAIQRCLEIEPNKSSYIDFDDMLWLPLMLDLDFSPVKFDLLIADEIQDANKIQHELTLRSGSRLICVGDRRQSIYQFRGADSQSMDTLKKALAETERGVIELSLQTTFRLPLSGVENVKSYAPDLCASDSAIEGEIKNSTVGTMKPQPGDLVLSRINVNIFSKAFSLLREKIPVRIQGRDFGKQVKNLLETICDKAVGLAEIQQRLSEYEKQERMRLMQRTFPERAINELEEKMNCLYSLIGGCKDLAEMYQTLDELFNEDMSRNKVVLLSTIHRAKGMEADVVWFLEPQLIPHKLAETESEIKQEMNLKFVAETRHKHTLVYVYAGNDNEENRELVEGRLQESQEVSK